VSLGERIKRLLSGGSGPAVEYETQQDAVPVVPVGPMTSGVPPVAPVNVDPPQGEGERPEN
jgi:hypothetical protein